MTAEPLLKERHVRSILGRHQYKIATSTKRLILAGMGIGAGKTHVGTAKILKWSVDSPVGVSHIIAANSYTQLFDSTLESLYKNLSELGVTFKPRTLPSSPSSYGPWNLHIWNGLTWVRFRCRSLAKWELISGQEAGCAWIDEAWDSPVEGYRVIGDRCRDKRMPYNQRLVTTTLDEIDSWLYAVFVENHESIDKGVEGHWKWSESDNQLVVYASTAANARHLPDHYIADRLSDYTELEAQRMIGSGPDFTDPPTWGSRQATIYHAFDETIHVDEAAEYDEMLPIRWTHDFNIGEDKPMSSVLYQLKPGTYNGRRRFEMHCFDEIVIDSADTNDIIAEWEDRAENTWQSAQGAGDCLIRGDASGRARDTRSKTSDYGLLKAAGFTNQNVPTHNPAIRTRHNRCNGLLSSADGDVRVRIHPRCKTLRKGLRTVRLKPGAQYLELDTREQHVTTAFGYAVMVDFPDRQQRGKMGKAMLRQR